MDIYPSHKLARSHYKLNKSLVCKLQLVQNFNYVGVATARGTNNSCTQLIHRPDGVLFILKWTWLCVINLSQFDVNHIDSRCLSLLI